MIQEFIKPISLNDYHITVIDHINQLLTKISIGDVREHFNCNLSQFDSVVMTKKTHKAIKSTKQYKPAKSTIIVTDTPSGVDANRVISYSDYSTLSCKFANPRLCTDLFIDKIELTIPLDKDEAKKLYKGLFNDKKVYKRVKFKKHSNPRAVKYFHSFIVTTKQFGSLHLMLNPVSGKINELKVTYNPSNYNPKDIKVLTKKLKKLCGHNYAERITTTNITRFDVTFDSDGYLAENVRFNIDKSSHFKTYISPDGTIESVISGADGSKRAQFYDKTAERLNKGIAVDPNIVNTRFEMTIRPHNLTKVKGLKFGEVTQEQNLWANLHIYDFDKLRALIGEETADWKIAKYFGIAALRRTKNNTERVKLGDLLKECRLKIDESEFNQLIQEKLSDIYKVFTNTKY